MRRLNVLVVHPDASVAERIAECARAVGHEARVVTSGERAVDSFVLQPSDLIVVNLFLPGRDGASTVETIRWAPGGEQVPVILVGAPGQEPALEHMANRLGALATLRSDAGHEVIARTLRIAAQHKHQAVTRELFTERTITLAGTQSISEEIELEDFDDDLYTDAEASDVSELTLDADPIAVREGLDVEKRATAVDRIARVEGNLRDMPFPRLLARLADLRGTGALVITAERGERPTTSGESAKKVVFFRHGVPQHVRSNLVEECLGQVLERSGAISGQALEESLERVREGAGRQGGILIAMGAISPHELREALENQQRLKLFDLFRWDEGAFQFSEKMEPPPETVTLEMSLSEIVYDGVTATMHPQVLVSHLEEHLESYVVPDPTRLAPFFDMDLRPEARRVLEALTGSERLRELIEVADPWPAAATQLVYALECIGAVHYKANPATGRRRTKGAVPRSPAERTAVRVTAEGDRTSPAVSRRARSEVKRAPGHRPSREERPPFPRDEAGLATANQRPYRANEPGPEPRVTHGRAELPPSMETREDREAMTWPGGTKGSRSEETGTGVDARSLDERVDRTAQAERCFRRGERALKRGRAADAVVAFEQAAKLCPDEGEFVAWLGYARHAASGDEAEAATRALEELNLGCRLAPKLDVIHVLRGRVLRARGDVVAARNAYERALAANPDCQEALEGLRDLS